MKYIEFVKQTVSIIDENLFCELRESVLKGEYICFIAINEPTDITHEVLSEKLCDYFEKYEFKNAKPFDKQVNDYIRCLDDLIEERIAKKPKAKKNTAPPVTPRARRYYEKAQTIISGDNLTIKQLLDYTRIMLCLYTAIISNKEQAIDNFDYSVKCLDINRILSALMKEKSTNIIDRGKKSRFHLEDKYSTDNCAFIILILLYSYIKQTEVKGEYQNA